MAGNQVLEWADLDSEIKTAEVKNVSCMVDKLYVVFTHWWLYVGSLGSSRSVSHRLSLHRQFLLIILFRIESLVAGNMRYAYETSFAAIPVD